MPGQTDPDPATCTANRRRVPEPIVTDPDGNLVDCKKPSSDSLRRTCDVAREAEEYLYDHFGWWGTDGKGGPIKVKVVACGQDSWFTNSLSREITIPDCWEDGKGTRDMLHELTHVLGYQVGARGSGPDAAAVGEGFAQLAEWEYTGGSSSSWPGAFSPEVLDPTYRPDGFTDDEPHTEGLPIMRAGAWLAIGLAERAGAVDRLRPATFDWETEARIRMRATTAYLQADALTDSVDNAAVRRAYRQAAQDLGVDPALVDQAFDSAGVPDLSGPSGELRNR